MSHDPASQIRRELLARISRNGYTMQQVIGAGRGDETFLFTVGLPAHLGHPELVICGIDQHTSIDVIEGVVDLLRTTPQAEGRIVGALEGDVPLWLTPLPTAIADQNLVAARWWRREHHDGEPPAATQIIIPDPEGLFPWQPGCTPEYARHQALLLPEVAVREPGLAEAKDNDARGD
jgi:hypothetical protein